MDISYSLLLMISAVFLLHIFADFHLQGILADLKQKKWWLDNVFTDGFNHKYDKDYIAALVIHGFEWSVLVHIPFMLMILDPHPLGTTLMIGASIIVQAILHAAIDHLKCNRFKLNLIQDQLLHLVQLISIIVTCILAFGLFA